MFDQWIGVIKAHGAKARREYLTSGVYGLGREWW